MPRFPRLLSLSALLGSILLPAAASAASFAVDTTADSGAGSLRQAILDANTTPGADTITFAIGTGAQTISPASALPLILEAVELDGASQPGFSGMPLIRIDGASAGAGVSGLVARAMGITIRSLSVTGFTWNGIEVGPEVSGVTIVGCHVGVLPDGVTPAGNGGDGIRVSWSDGTVIGGGLATERNVVSANGRSGIALESTGFPPVNGGRGATGSGGLVLGNHIGTDVTGTVDLGNNDHGVQIDDGFDIQVGSSTAGNLISGNRLDGVIGNAVEGTSSSLLVVGNRIGTNAAGSAAIPNGGAGIYFAAVSNSRIGGGVAGESNLVSGNLLAGILVHGPSNGISILGNLIGTTAAGLAGIPNQGDGIQVADDQTAAPFAVTIGSVTPGEGNRIVGNGSAGVVVESLQGFFPTATISGNSIHSNTGPGIDLTPFGATANDAGDGDVGPNGLQNTPTLSFVDSVGGNTTFDGSLSSLASTNFRIEFFWSATADPSGFGEGANFAGSTNVATDGTGVANFNVVLPGAIPIASAVAATATNLATGETSEFGPALASVPVELVRFEAE